LKNKRIKEPPVTIPLKNKGIKKPPVPDPGEKLGRKEPPVSTLWKEKDRNQRTTGSELFRAPPRDRWVS